MEIQQKKRLAFFSLLLFLAMTWVSLDYLFAFSKAETARVMQIPNVCGLLASEIEQYDWIEAHTEYRYDAQIPAGVVISQTPAAGSFQKLSERFPTCELSLVVSLGEENLVLPDVVGEDIRHAAPLLRQEGFVVETVMQQGLRPQGEVLSMMPVAGSVLPRGGVVTLTVSAGEATQTVEVPDVRGLSGSDALIRLWMCQLHVKEVIEEFSAEAGGTVIRQSHQPGTVVLTGTSITLYVSKEK